MFNFNYDNTDKTVKNTKGSGKFRNVIILLLLVAVIVFILNILTYHNYLKYEEAIESVDVNSNGVITIYFTDKVSGYKIEDDREMIAWSNLFDSLFKVNNQSSIILNPGGKRIPTTLLYISDGELDKTIFGDVYAEDGAGQITLPRLAIGMYISLGAIVIVTLIILRFLFRKYIFIQNIISVVTMIPLSYIISAFLIKGFSTSSHDIMRDFWFIGIMMLLVFMILLLLYLTRLEEVKKD